MDERKEVSVVIFWCLFTFFVWICRGRSTVVYGCSFFGFSLLLESLVTGQSRNLPLGLAWRSTWVGWYFQSGLEAVWFCPAAWRCAPVEWLALSNDETLYLFSNTCWRNPKNQGTNLLPFSFTLCRLGVWSPIDPTHAHNLLCWGTLLPPSAERLRSLVHMIRLSILLAKYKEENSCGSG